MPSPAASPIPTWLLLVLMAFGTKRHRVDRRGSEAAGDGDECKGRDGQGCPFSTAEYKQRRESNGDGNGLKRYCKRCSKNKIPRPEPARQHVDTAASTSQQPQQPRDMNSVLGARGTGTGMLAEPFQLILRIRLRSTTTRGQTGAADVGTTATSQLFGRIQAARSRGL